MRLNDFKIFLNVFVMVGLLVGNSGSLWAEDFPVEAIVRADSPETIELRFIEPVQSAKGGFTVKRRAFDGKKIVSRVLKLARKEPEIRGTSIRIFLSEIVPVTGILEVTFDARKGKILLAGGRTVPAFSLLVESKSGMVAELPKAKQRPWIGPDFWANRLQDWRLRYGRIECMEAGPGKAVRTVHLVTREVIKGRQELHLSVRMGTLAANNGTGFSGLLIGAGAGDLDYRAAALIHQASGEGGGILCVMDMNGKLSFRDYSDNYAAHSYPELPARSSKIASPVPRTRWDDIRLDLDILPAGRGKFDLHLSAWNDVSGKYLDAIALRGVEELSVLGSLALVSSPMGAGAGPRFWFRDIRVAGGKVQAHPDRNIGPVITTLFSLHDRTLKLTAQFMPLGFEDGRTAVLEYRASGANNAPWQATVPQPIVTPGYAALFRVENWDDSKSWDFRIIYPGGVETFQPFTGRIPKNPIDEDELVVAAFTGMSPMAYRPSGGGLRVQGEADKGVGRWTPANVWMPQRGIVENVARLGTDILFFTGDQIYQGTPTPAGNDARMPDLDYLYKWYIWALTFRDITRDRPTIVLLDDHDVYHGNIWGQAGRRNNPETAEGYSNWADNGGYRYDPEFVNMIQRISAGHNPDPYDPTPILQGIDVYYTGFNYGEVGFAVLEDRKFKSSPRSLLPDTYPYALDGTQVFDDGHVIHPDYDIRRETPSDAILLGRRQLEFLRQWSEDWTGVKMKIAVSQGPFICAHTTPHGPQGNMDPDLDSGGWPKHGRDQVVDILRRARVLSISGDQHLPYVAQLGIESHRDASYAFSVPSTGNYYSRWFYPKTPGVDHVPGQPPYTGGYEDAFGNKFTMLALGNPVPGQQLIAGRYGFGNDGFGLVRVDKKRKTFRMECWPWNGQLESGDQGQFPGWPVEITLEDNDGREAVAYLPDFTFFGLDDPVIQVIDEQTGSVVYTTRAVSGRYRPKVFKAGRYSVKVGEPGTAVGMRSFTGLQSNPEPGARTITVTF